MFVDDVYLDKMYTENTAVGNPQKGMEKDKDSQKNLTEWTVRKVGGFIYWSQ